MSSHDPAIPLNCPYCRARLAYERTEGETHYYTCPRFDPELSPPRRQL